MKIGKAIEVLQLICHQGSGCFDDDDMDAVKLGIEAIKEVERLRRVEAFDPTIALPGETED